MSDKATPRPWRAFTRGRTVAIFDGRNGREVLHWSGFDSSPFPLRIQRANAHLIVAAVNAYDAHCQAVKALRRLEARLTELEAPIFEVTALANIHGHTWTAGTWLAEREAARAALRAVDEASK